MSTETQVLTDGGNAPSDAAVKTPAGADMLPAAAGKRERNVVLDILRIVAILFIVFHHFVINNVTAYTADGTGVTFSSLDTGVVVPQFIPMFLGSEFIDCILIVGVNLFFLLSGFFSIRLKPAKIVQLLLKTYVYFTLGELIAFAAGVTSYGSAADAAIGCLTAPAKYWFVLVYCALCIIAPLLNKFAEKLDGKSIALFVTASVVFCCFIGFISDFWFPYIGTNDGYSLLWAGVVYMYGRLISLRGFGTKRKPAFWFGVFAAAVLLNYTVVALLTAVAREGAWAWHMYGYNNPLVALASVAFFMAFRTMRPVASDGRAAKAVSAVAGHTLGVYLIHCNNPIVSPYRAFLLSLTANTLWAQYLLLIPNVLIIFVGAVLIDMLFDKATHRLFAVLSRAAERFVIFLYNLLSQIFRRLFGSPDGATQ